NLAPDPKRLIEELPRLQVRPGTPIIAIGPASDPKLILRAMQFGIAAFVDEADLKCDLPAALTRITGGLGGGKQGRVIALLAPSGCAASSTLAVNIATALAKEHRSAMLMDLKLPAGDLDALLDLKPVHTMADLCEKLERLDRTMLERTVVRHDSGVHLLASPTKTQDAAKITPAVVRQVTSLARAVFPYVVIDLDHTFAPEQVQVLTEADIILLVMRLDFTSLRNARRALDFIDNLGISRDRIEIVINRYG